MKIIKGLSILSVVVFTLVLCYNVSFETNPIGYLLILGLFVAESIRAYIEGIGRGIEIIKEIKGE